MKPNKYTYFFVIQGHYGGSAGWEDLTFEDTRQEGRAMLQCYNDNEPQYAHRLIQRRVPNPQAAQA